MEQDPHVFNTQSTKTGSTHYLYLALLHQPSLNDFSPKRNQLYITFTATGSVTQNKAPSQIGQRPKPIPPRSIAPNPILKLPKYSMSGNASNNGINTDPLDNMTQAEMEGDNDFGSPLIAHDWDAAHGGDIFTELIDDEDIPESSIGSPLISNNQGLQSNIVMGGSTLVPSYTTDSTTISAGDLNENGESIYGADVTGGQFLVERAPTPPDMEWVIGTYPRQYRSISILPESSENERRTFTTASNLTDTTEDNLRAQKIAFIGTDIRDTTGSMIPKVDDSGRPMHFVNENGVRYSSGIFMFQTCIMNIVKCIEEQRYRHAHDALYEFCILYANAASMTKYKQTGDVVNDAREMDGNAGIPNHEGQAANDKVQQHVEELTEITELALDFLNLTPFVKTGVSEVEEAREECLTFLVVRMVEVEAMEKTWRTWNQADLLIQEIAQAVYELGIICMERL